MESPYFFFFFFVRSSMKSQNIFTKYLYKISLHKKRDTSILYRNILPAIVRIELYKILKIIKIIRMSFPLDCLKSLLSK